jgi:hypothetical protein
MSSAAIATVTKLLETLPETAQEQVAEHLRKYIEDLRDDLKWDNSLKQTQAKLIEVARRAKQEIAEGKAQPMDYEQL